ncbi:late embryogenesis abundant protein- putative / LEA protein- putative [Striga hermonthica]|uniref:Late embryogenesis abundant protein- putative / LEA protein- putative n=1 Tax=Striga hermonthica TaxID=68872 RepID=A0A9N7NU41_STRHE|nr:late embryogenesis abundant protein- putative / LEA protein- putative [Striga hermonthica]
MASRQTAGKEEKADAAADELHHANRERREGEDVETAEPTAAHAYGGGGAHEEKPQPGVIGSIICTVQGAKDAVVGKSRNDVGDTAAEMKDAASEHKDREAEKTKGGLGYAADKARQAKDAAAAEKAAGLKDAAAGKVAEVKDTAAGAARRAVDYLTGKTATASAGAAKVNNSRL